METPGDRRTAGPVPANYLHLCPKCRTLHFLNGPCGKPTSERELTAAEKSLLLEMITEFQMNHGGWDRFPRVDPKEGGVQHISLDQLRAKLSTL